MLTKIKLFLRKSKELKSLLFLTLFIILQPSIAFAQDNNLWNSGSFGGPAYFGQFSNDNLYFGQTGRLHTANLDGNNITVEEDESLFWFKESFAQFKISGDNFFAIYSIHSENKNWLVRSTFSDPSRGTSTTRTENGIKKFEETDNGFIVLSHNKDGVICNFLEGYDFLGNNSKPGFQYKIDFIDFTINENIAYIIEIGSNNKEAISIIDYSDKSDVKEVGKIEIDGAASLFYRNNLLYVACNNANGLKIVNVSNPSLPTLTGEYQTGIFSKVIVEGNTVYLTHQNRITLLNISDAANPTYINDAVIGDISNNMIMTDVNENSICYSDNGILGLIDATSLTIDKRYLSPVSSDWVHADGTTLVVYDKLNYYFHSLENRGNPKVHSILPVTEEPIDFIIDKNTFYVAYKEKIEIYNTQNLTAPPSVYNLAGEFLFFDVSHNLIAVAGVSRRNGAHEHDYMELIDVSDLQNPQKLYEKEDPVFGRMSSFSFNFDNSVLYVSSEGDDPSSDDYQLIWISTFNIQTPSSPIRVNIMELANGETTKGKDVKLSTFNNELYLVTNYLTQNDYYAAKLFAYSLVDSLKPALISGLQITESEYSNAVFLQEMCLVSVPADDVIHMYRLDGEIILRKKWVQEQTVSLGTDPNNLTIYLESPDQLVQLTRNEKGELPQITGGKKNYYVVYESQKTKGTKIRYGTKSISIEWDFPTTKFTVTTSVLPDAASKDKCSLSGAGSYLEGKSATFTPKAATGWLPWEYSGDLDGKLVQKTVPVTKNMNVVGIFKPELKITMSSPEAGNHCPQCGQEEDFLITTVYLEAGGVKWDLASISFEAVGETKTQYVEAYLKVKGQEIKGTIADQGTNFIKFIHFELNNWLKKDEKLPIEFYYRIVVPYENQQFKYSEALNEVKNMAVKTNSEMISCYPTLKEHRPGIKTPIGQDFVSNTQTMANIWNISTTPELPFETVQKAIDDEETLDGHTIEVCDGYYKSQNILVDKALKIIGSGRENCYMEADHFRGVFLIKSDNVEINGFSLLNKMDGVHETNTDITQVINIYEGFNEIKIIENTFYYNVSQFLLHAQNSNNIEISNNIFELTDNTPEFQNGKAILFKYCKKPIIKDNKFNDNRFAIHLKNCPNVEIINNTFTRVITEINVQNSNDLIIRSNKFYEKNYSEFRPIDQGISVTGSNNSRIELNDFYDNNICIDISGSDNLLLNTNAHKTKNKHISIYINNCIKGSLINNEEIILQSKSNRANQISNLDISNNRLISIDFQNVTNSNIEKNTIIYSPKNSASIFDCSDIKIIDNDFLFSKLSGIHVKNSHNIEIKKNDFMHIGNSAIIIEGDKNSTSLTRILHNEIKHTPDKVAVIAMNLSGDIFLINNDIYTAKQAIHLQKLNTGRVEFNNLYRNGTAIRTAFCKDLVISRNHIEESADDYTGIHLVDTKAVLEGNNLVDNNGAAIGLWNNSTATINDNNFIDNPDLAIFNESGSVVTSAEDNYWGSSSEPNGNLFDGDVSVKNWLIQPVDLVVDAVEDSVQIPSGTSDSTTILLTNYIDKNDQIELSITDEKGWLTNGGTHSIILNDSSFTIFELKYEVPSDAGTSFNNKVIVTAKSVSDTNVTAIDSFYIMNYSPKLNAFRIFPDSVSVSTGDTLQLSVSPLDQYQKDFVGEYTVSWSVSLGSIDSTGLFIAPKDESVVTIEVTEETTGVKSFSQLSILNNPSLPEAIIITPDSIKLQPDSEWQFFAQGIDKNGFNISVDCEWSTNAGTIDSMGMLTVGSQSGIYTLTAKDKNSDVEATAYITILKPTDVEEIEDIIPTTYALDQNYPNPFNPSTVVSYQLPVNSFVNLHIYNVLGQRVATLADNKSISAGTYKQTWNASSLSSGVYFLVMNAKSIENNKEFHSVKKMMLLK